jgi:hypothetical protein
MELQPAQRAHVVWDCVKGRDCLLSTRCAWHWPWQAIDAKLGRTSPGRPSPLLRGYLDPHRWCTDYPNTLRPRIQRDGTLMRHVIALWNGQMESCAL